jgi:hypothetical protein
MQEIMSPLNFNKKIELIKSPLSLNKKKLELNYQGENIPKDIHQQIVLYRDKFTPFFHKNKIKLVTEHQLRAGTESLGFNEERYTDDKLLEYRRKIY